MGKEKSKGKTPTSKKIKNGEKAKLPSSKIDIELTAGSTENAMKAAEAKSTKLFKVPVASIKTIPGFNVRVDSADYQAHKGALVQSINENGYDTTKPLAGYVAKEGDSNVIYVTDGHTRLAAVNEINEAGGDIATLPVLVHPAGKSLTDLTVALHTANSGRGLTPFELGVVVKRLLRDEGIDKKAIAKRLTITPRYLDDVLILVNAPKEVRDLVLAGTVSSTLAIEMLRSDPDTAAEKLTAAAESLPVGKTKVTAKAVAKTKKVKVTVEAAKGDDIKSVNKAVRTAIANALPHTPGDSAEDATTTDVKATITIIVEIPAPKKKPAAKAEIKAKAKEAAEEATAEAKAKGKSSKKKGSKASKPAPEPSDTDEDDDGLGIEGAEEVDDSDLDSEELANLPPKVGGEEDDDESI